MSDDQGKASFARLTRDSLVYSLGSVAGKAVGLLLLPILTRALSISEFGRLDLLSTLLSALISALLLGLDSSALRTFFDLVTERDRRRMSTTWFVIATAVTTLGALALVATRSWISQALFGSTAYGLAVALVAVALVVGTWEILCLTMMRMRRRPAAYARVEGVNLVVTAGATVIALVTGHRTAAAVLVATSVGYVAAVLVCPGLFTMITARPSRRIGRTLLRLGLPLAPGVIATWGADFANRAILARQSGIDQVAYFSVAVRFGSVGVLIATSFELAWLPEAYVRGEEDQAHERTAHEARRIVSVLCMVSAGLALVSRELLLVLGGRRYLPALGAVGWAELLGVALAVALVAAMPSSLVRRFGDIGIATTIGTLLGVATNIALAHRFGATGTSAAVTAGVATGGVVLAVIGRRRFPLAIPWMWILANVAVAAVVVLGCCLPTGGASIPIRLALGAAAAVIFWLEGTAQEALRWASSRLRRRHPSSTS